MVGQGTDSGVQGGALRHIIVGTAGHVDHGKSALVTAMTGQDPDRLPEEKQRGLTIDLGFAWCDLPAEDGTVIRVGFVDVPGHERFIDHMVSGVIGMDLVIFTVASDEGMMPQSYEHLDILDMLGVERGIIVITKCDRADSASVDALIRQIHAEMQGTFLENAPVIRTSALTGEGMEELRISLREQAAEMTAQRSDGPKAALQGRPARLPVDRVFSRQGFGTIVTGTLISGVIDRDSRLAVYPEGIPCRLRALQSYGQEVKQAAAGQRLALNLAKIGTDQLRRGDVVAEEGSLRAASFLHVCLSTARFCHRQIESGMRVRLLIGTARVFARLYLFRGDDRLAQLRLESPAAVMPGDRFILRFYSPLETIGGGRVLETADRKVRMSDGRMLARLRALERGEQPPGERHDTGSGREAAVPPIPEKEIPPAYQKCADWLLQKIGRAGYSLISVHSLTDTPESPFSADRIRTSLRLLGRTRQLVRLDDNHYTTPAIADEVAAKVCDHFRGHEELSLGELRDQLETSRTSARAFFTYLDRRGITRQTGGASVRTAGQTEIAKDT